MHKKKCFENTHFQKTSALKKVKSLTSIRSSILLSALKNSLLINMPQIGPYELKNNLFLAPMVGVSDTPFREICGQQGAGLTIGEMLTCNKELWLNERNRLKQVKPRISGPQVVQIAGSDPALMAEAAKLNVALGADAIDINMGCPAKKVLKKAAGSALLKDTKLVREILHAVVNSVDAPVTLKIRTGWCPETRNGVEVAKIAEGEGVQLLTVHGRTRADRFKGEAEYDTIAQIKQAVSIPVIGCGGIRSAEDVMEFLVAGATAVQVGTWNYAQPDGIARIVDDLRDLCRRENIESLSPWIGSLDRTPSEADAGASAR